MQASGLTDLQERVLLALCEAEDREPKNWYHPNGWYPVEWVMERRSLATLARLEELGLIETHGRLDLDKRETRRAELRRKWRLRGTGARTTEAGRVLLASMGD